MLAISGRVNAHSSFRDEWLIRVEQLRSNFIRGVVKSVSYSHVSSQVLPDLRLRPAVEVERKFVKSQRFRRLVEEAGADWNLEINGHSRLAPGLTFCIERDFSARACVAQITLCAPAVEGYAAISCLTGVGNSSGWSNATRANLAPISEQARQNPSNRWSLRWT